MRSIGAPRRPLRLVWAVVAVMATVLGITATAAAAATQRYVVILKDGSSAAQVAADAKADGVTPSMTYGSAVSGYAGPASSASLTKIRSDPTW